jgi:rhodanese-related sulfurtransferase
LGNDLTRISEETLAILKNAEMIAVNQDAACLPATLAVKDNNKEIWVKDLGGQNSGTRAVALLNRSNSQLSITVDFVKDLRFSGPVKIRDLWAHENPAPASSYTTAEMPARGIVVLKVEGDYIPPAGNAAGPTPVRAPSGYMDIANAKRAVAGGATLVDVRSAEEYNAFHIDGAINIDYAVIPEEAGEALPDKNALIIVYCSAGKRSAQALSMLQELGYGKVYNIGPLSDWLNSSP